MLSGCAVTARLNSDAAETAIRMSLVLDYDAGFSTVSPGSTSASSLSAVLSLSFLPAQAATPAMSAAPASAATPAQWACPASSPRWPACANAAEAPKTRTRQTGLSCGSWSLPIIVPFRQTRMRLSGKEERHADSAAASTACGAICLQQLRHWPPVWVSRIQNLSQSLLGRRQIGAQYGRVLR